MTYYQEHKEEMSKQQKEYHARPEVKERVREREKLTKRSIEKTLDIHEELLKHDSERLKRFFIEEQIAIVRGDEIK